MKPKSCLLIFLVLVLISISNIPAHSSDNDKSQILQMHTVKAGENLSTIALEYYGDYNQTNRIAEFNDIKDINKLKIGQEIKIPVLLLEQTKKPSRITEEDLGTSKQGEAEKITVQGQKSSQEEN